MHPARLIGNLHCARARAPAVTNPIGNLIIPAGSASTPGSVAHRADRGPPNAFGHLGSARRIAKALNFTGEVHLVDGRYTYAVDDPYGLRCGKVYYGPTPMTHDIYTRDAATMIGTLASSFDAGCDGAPGTLTYPISLVRP
jgi:hypothetical protein